MKTLKIAIGGIQGSGKESLIRQLISSAQDLHWDDTTHDLNLKLVESGARKNWSKLSHQLGPKFFKWKNKKISLVDMTPQIAQQAEEYDLALLIIEALSIESSVKTLFASHLRTLLRVKRIIICVNKMDLINYEESEFKQISERLKEQVKFIHPQLLDIIPISAFFNEGIATSPKKMSWSKHEGLLDHLENLNLEVILPTRDIRIALQTIIQHDGSTYYGGKLISGNLEVGQTLLCGHDKKELSLNRLYIGDKSVMRASAGASITFTLQEEIRLELGDILYSGGMPSFSTHYSAYLYWINEPLFHEAREYIITKNSKQTRAKITLKQCPKEHHFIQAHLCAQTLLDFDPFMENSGNGRFIVVDPETGSTMAAGIIEKALTESA